MFNIPTVTVDSETLDLAAASVTLTYAAPVGVAWTPRHLLVRVNGSGSVSVNALLRLNGDTGANYNQQRLSGIGSSASASRTNSSNETVVAQFGTTVASVEILLPDALSTRSHKSGLSFAGDSELRVDNYAFRWASTAAITSVTIFGVGANFTAGSTFELCVVDESFNIDQAGDGEQILSSRSALTVSSIAASNGDLVQIGNLRDVRTNAIANTYVQYLNGDSGSNYYTQQMLGGNTSVSSASYNSAYAVAGICPSAPAGANQFGAYLAIFPNYSGGSNDRSALTLFGLHQSDPYSQTGMFSTRWDNTAAINEVNLTLLVGSSAGVGFDANSMLSTYAVPKNLIERQELSGTASSVTFNSIPQTYDHLELTLYIRGDSSGQPEAGLRNEFNGDTTVANYKRQHLIAYGTTVGAGTNDNNMPVDFPTTTSTANVFGSVTYTIQNYTKTDRHKHYMVTAGDADENEIRTTSNRWTNTAAISSIVFTPSAGNFIAGSVFTLRGISSTIPAASDITSINGIAKASITAVN